MTTEDTGRAPVTAWGAVRLAVGIAVTVLGTLLLLSALPAALAAGGIQASVGRTGVVSQPLGDLRAAPGDIAVVVDGVSARLVTPTAPTWVDDVLALAGTDTAALATELGEVTLIASPASDTAFLGVANVEDVNDYLDGTPYSVAVRQADGWPTVSVPGTGTPTRPEDQPWWRASSAGPAPELAAESLDGQTLVLMRPDASADPAASLRLQYRVPGADAALQSAALTAAGAALGGLLLILLGGWLIVGRRRPTGTPA